MIDVVPAGADRIGELEHMWTALTDHHGEIAPQLGPIREADDTWRRRRGFYERALGEPGALLLIAEQDGRPVGYAMVTRTRPSFTWPIERAATVETLAVLPDHRGQGVGSALLERVRQELRADGCTHWSLSAVAANEAAIRFYRRHGFEVAFIEMLGRP